MGLHIATNLMWDEATPHTARLHDSGWAVSWLPARILDRNQAITAMTIAVTIPGLLQPGGIRWVHVEAWAAELGLTLPDVVGLVSQPPPDAAR